MVMRVLHVVKTSDGADWAAAQAAELVRLGVEIHVALPHAQGRTVQKWVDGGAIIHIVPTDLPIRSPWLLPATTRRLRDLVSAVRPDMIHSHFFGSTVLLRLALGAGDRTPRIFQVPGPLHLEHRLWRAVDLSTAKTSGFMVFVLWFVSLNVVLFGMGMSNFGLLARERVMILPMIVLLLAACSRNGKDLWLSRIACTSST